MINFFKQFTTKIIVCTNCGQRTRVPVKFGKILLVTCPTCQHKFEIQFENPTKNLHNTIKGFSSQQGLQHLFKQPKIKRYIPFIIAGLIFIMFKSCFVSPQGTMPQHMNTPGYPTQQRLPNTINL